MSLPAPALKAVFREAAGDSAADLDLVIRLLSAFFTKRLNWLVPLSTKLGGHLYVLKGLVRNKGTNVRKKNRRK
jgi:hypothetical protein